MTIELKIFGVHAVVAALQSPLAKVKKIEITKETLERISAIMPINKQLLQICNKDHFGQEAKHQGVIAWVDYKALYSISECLQLPNHSTFLLLDHLQDPQNLGSAIRNATAFGVDAVLLPRHQAAPLNGTVASASVGCLFKTPVALLNNMNQVLKELKEEGYGVIGLSAHATENIGPQTFWPKSVILIGQEGKGLAPSLEKQCDTLVRIPMSPACESLNASISAGIACYHRYTESVRK